MKKVMFSIAVLVFVCILNSCASSPSLNYPEPTFDKPFAHVIDVFKVTGYRGYNNGRYYFSGDYIKLHSRSTDSNIKFRIYLHDPGSHEWIAYGTGSLKDTGDIDTINSGMDIDDHRYFAIESLDGKDYDYQCYIRRNDLHITVEDK